MQRTHLFGSILLGALLSGCSLTFQSNYQAMSSPEARVMAICQGKVAAVNGKLVEPTLGAMSTEQYQTYTLCVLEMTKRLDESAKSAQN